MQLGSGCAGADMPPDDLSEDINALSTGSVFISLASVGKIYVSMMSNACHLQQRAQRARGWRLAGTTASCHGQSTSSTRSSCTSTQR